MVDDRVIVSQRSLDVEMVRNRRLQRAEGSVVEEGRGHLQVAQRRGAEGVPQRRIAARFARSQNPRSRRGRRRSRCRVPMPNSGASCGPPIRCGLKSLNISLDWPATAWQATHPALPKKSNAPRFWPGVMACVSPRAKRSSGALADVRVASNSAMARRRMLIVMPPGGSGTPPLKTIPNFSKYSGIEFSRASTAS